jgi:hypothetical protein
VTRPWVNSTPTDMGSSPRRGPVWPSTLHGGRSGVKPLTTRKRQEGGQVGLVGGDRADAPPLAQLAEPLAQPPGGPDERVRRAQELLGGERQTPRGDAARRGFARVLGDLAQYAIRCSTGGRVSTRRPPPPTSRRGAVGGRGTARSSRNCVAGGGAAGPASSTRRTRARHCAADVSGSTSAPRTPPGLRSPSLDGLDTGC